MKKIFLILFLPVLFNCQNILLQDTPQFGKATDFDGSTEYCSKTSPINLDLSGTERVTTLTDRNFETSIGNWTATGTYTITRSDSQKYSGNYAGRIVVVGNGDSTTNYIELATSNYTALVNREKYTRENWYYPSVVCTSWVKIGSTVTSKVLSATSWQKAVSNFQVTSSTQINQPVRIWFTGITGTQRVWIDDYSITQSFDYLINCWVNLSGYVSHGSIYNSIFGYGNPVLNAGIGYSISYLNDNKLTIFLNSGSSQIAATSTSTFILNTWLLLQFYINRTGNAILYQNGELLKSTSIISLGKITGQDLYIGSDAASSIRSMKGIIGKVQITRFTDITQSNVSAPTLLSAYRNGIPRVWVGGGAQVSLITNWKGTTDASMLYDWSGTGNNLTGTNITTADQVTGSYPSK